MNPYAVGVFARILVGRGHELNGAIDLVTPDTDRRFLQHLADLPPESQGIAHEAYLALQTEKLADTICKALAEVDLESPLPDPDSFGAPACLADLRRVRADERWIWERYIPRNTISGIAAFEGVGKTRLALDLAKRVYCAELWPDRQDPTFPPGTPSLWVCADGQQYELADAASAYDLPDDALFFNTPKRNPDGGTDLDDEDALPRLKEYIKVIKPGLVFVDSLTYATDANLNKANEVKLLVTPLRDIAQQFQTTIVLLLHLSKEEEALGRRIRGLTRTLMHLECLDKDNPERLKLWMRKSFAKKPVALGVTMTDTGNQYDFDPPSAPEPNRGGRPPTKTPKAETFIVAKLTEQNDRKATELCDEWVASGESDSTFWRARDVLVKAGKLVCDGKPKILHLVVVPPAASTASTPAVPVEDDPF
jgi:hypothetical protein